jgi:transposase
MAMGIRFERGPCSVGGGTVRALHLPPTFALVLPLLRKLGLSRIVDEHCPIRSDADMTHGQVVEALILHILQDNRRLPLYKLQEWAAKHELHLLYGCAASALNDDRIARTLDALAPVRQEVHMQIVTALLMAYEIDVRSVLWDVTHVSFSGAYEQSTLIEAGYGHGTVHEKQIKLSMHVDSETGLPLNYRELAGAANQTPLAEDFLRELQQRLGRSDLIVVSDRAGVSYENIVAYRSAKARFVAPLQATPTETAVIAQTPAEAFAPLCYRSTSKPQETYSYYPVILPFVRQNHREPLNVAALLIHSTQKQRDDKTKRAKAVASTLTELGKVTGYLNEHRYAHRQYAEEQLTKKVPRALRGIVRWQLTGEDKQMSLHYHVDEAALALAERADGRYLLVHNLQDSPDEIFALYKRQYLVEARFRNFNSDLRVHPVWLHKQPRIEALLLIWVLALTIFVLLGLLAERAGLDNEPYYPKLTARAMIELFVYATVIQFSAPGQPPRYHIQLDDRPLEILAALNIDNPHELLSA